MSSQYQNINNGPYKSPLNTDMELGDNQAEKIQMVLRLGFIRKVYAVLSMQLAMTIGISLLSLIPEVGKFFISDLNLNVLIWVALGLSIMIMIPLVCFKKVARKVPINYILLFSFTTCESWLIATVVAITNGPVVIMAAVLTVLITLALTIYAFTTKTDFTYCGGLLFVFCTLLFGWSILSLIIGFYAKTLYCVLGVFLYSFYLIYDTQLVLGKFGNEYSIDDYIYAALAIYIDIIEIFLYILQLFSRR